MARQKSTERTDFGVRLRRLREGAGLSQVDLAAASGINRVSINKIEQARNEPSWPTVIRLAKALGVDCTAFVGA